MEMPTNRRSLLAAGAIVAATVAIAPATAAPPKPKTPPSAVSQYVEQIPTARGSKATNEQTAKEAASAGTATSGGSDGRSSAGKTKPHAGKAPAASAPSAASNEPNPLRAAVGATDGGGLGRGAILAILVGGITLLAAVGLVLRARFRH